MTYGRSSAEPSVCSAHTQSFHQETYQPFTERRVVERGYVHAGVQGEPGPEIVEALNRLQTHVVDQRKKWATPCSVD